MESNGDTTMKCESEQAEILAQALPYIRKYYGKTVVIKYGGNAMIDEELKVSVMKDVVLLRYVGMQPVVVHGGGPDVSGMMGRVGLTPEFVDGLRVTDAATMEIAEMVLAGKTNKGIVSIVNQQGGQGVGLCGKDGNLFVARKALPGGKDLGYVGEVIKINTDLIDVLMREGYIPIISSIAIGGNGESYNINADHVAGELAAALKACKLVMLTDVEGVYRDFSDKSSLVSTLSCGECEELVESGRIGKGMIPKVEACVTALKGGVEKAHIINGTISHALLMEIFTDSGIGTMIL